SSLGLPTIVARNTMMDAMADSVFLPLVGRTVDSREAALEASSAEGADFLVITDGVTHSEELFRLLSEQVKLPIFLEAGSRMNGMQTNLDLLKSGASGIVLSVTDLNALGIASFDVLFHKKIVDGVNGKSAVPTLNGLEEKEQLFIERERATLLEVIDVIQRAAAPLIGDISLLKDAVSQLDDPFLLVIVGEFNSGKSSFINALLGERYLMDGVVPTTSEITFLRYSESHVDGQRCERHPDGQYVCYIPAPILKEMIIVDTPGTNVILKRQQRLTEEFIPRADLLLFVMSADRPLTESEVVFLRYTQQWKKKIIFVLNKSDLFRNEDEVEKIVSFVEENVRNMLNAENVTLFSVSSRIALEAKLSGFSGPYPGFNKFDVLEKYLYSFLDPSTSNGVERIKLKLETPVKIAQQIMNSSRKLAEEELQRAKEDLVSVNDIFASVEEYALKMEGESISWKRKISSLIDNAVARAIKLVESSLKLSNVDIVTSYILSREKYVQMPVSLSLQNEVMAPAFSEAQKLVGEYCLWLHSSSSRKANFCRDSFEKRWPFVVASVQSQVEANQLLRTKHEEGGVRVVADFSVAAAARLFDQEIRQVFVSTYGGLGAAGLSASLLTSILPTALEDLLALGLCSAGGYLSIFNFPARRKRAVEKVKRAAEALRREIEDGMDKDLSESQNRLRRSVWLFGGPYREMAEERVDRIATTLNEIADADGKLSNLHREI
ncbi:hypothetical protein M569_00446, partial [Genlisea aurea]